MEDQDRTKTVANTELFSKGTAAALEYGEQTNQQTTLKAMVAIRCAEINIQYSEVYNAAPLLPRPLKSQHLGELKHITGKGLKDESVAIAPLNADECRLLHEEKMDNVRSYPHDDEITRYSKRLLVYFHKAIEFSIIHEELALGYAVLIGRIDTLNLLTSVIVTFCASTPAIQEVQSVPAILGVTTFVAGIIKSWVSYAKYDTIMDSHNKASLGFKEITQEIENILESKLFPATETMRGNKSETAFRERMVEIGGSAGAAAINSHFEGAAKRRTYFSFSLRGNGAPATVICDDDLEDGTTGGAPAEAISDADIEYGFDVEKCSKAKAKMRLMYRMSAEYRLAHNLYETKYHKLRMVAAFVHLVLASTTAAVLLMPNMETLASVLSFLLTGLNGALKGITFGEMEVCISLRSGRRGAIRTFFLLLAL
jgi:hypothetical protein